MAKVSEPAYPGGMPGSAPPAKSGGQRMPSSAPAPASEPAFRTTPGRSTNKAPVAVDRQAFRTRGGKGNGS